MKSNRTKNKLTRISDNAAYQPYNINSEDVRSSGKATYIMGKANQQQRWDVNQLASMELNTRSRNR